MPYILSPIIQKNQKGLWGEGAPYETNSIYDINKSNACSTPPVHYESHTLKPHSLPHMDAPSHIIAGANSIDWFFSEKKFDRFFGRVLVVRLKGDDFKEHPVTKQPVWNVTLDSLKLSIQNVTGIDSAPERLLITVDHYPCDADGLYAEDHALVLEAEAAEWLVQENPDFKVYGTSWKSTDYQPGSSERPIHKILFSKNVGVFECLHLKEVPEGMYFWFAVPLPLAGASESPVCPMLLTEVELQSLMMR